VSYQTSRDKAELAEALAAGRRAVQRAAEQEQQQAAAQDAEREKRAAGRAAAQESARIALLVMFTQAQHRDHVLVSAAESGISLREISRITGLSRTTIAKIMARSKLGDPR
jgi:DNA-binding CsgD family transcriptional regulator